ncbi:PQQ-binding-like beta-propeller repeat protein [Halobacteria archaeon AArc-curdl1]|uniref:PQQ-binding-like beta-propeller repeat protein n=1 Tax=Natronosalvus hydrolyticus TaxID=2979988 RepID=A0AAP2ZA65_9EURY|nr:PQQ-binding-like beta-propeller repeat protein [Halobacteria archaeon AArc-curdl1]
MARNSVVHLVLFIAVVSVSAIAVGILVTQAGLYSQALEGESEREQASLETDLSIINDPEAGTTYDADSETVTLYVKNVGSRTLEPGDLDVLLDGEYVTATSAVVDGDDWRPGTVLEVTIDLEEPLERGIHRATVNVHGVSDTLEFTHRVVFWLEPDADGVTCDEERCVIDADEVDSLTVTMGTDPTQEDVPVEYAVNDTSVLSLESETGVTDSNGQNETVVVPEADGEASLVVDAGWDRDTLVFEVENATESDSWSQFGFDDRQSGFQRAASGPTTALEATPVYETDDWIVAGPAVSSSTVFVGSTDTKLYAVNRSTETLEWTGETNDEIRSTPAFDADSVYIGSTDGSVYAFDRGNGSEQWERPLDGEIQYSSVTLSANHLYAGTDNGTVYALDTDTGDVDWQFTEPTSAIDTSPAVVGDTVYVAAFDGQVYALDRDTGDERWSVDVAPGDHVVDGALAADDETVFVGTDDRVDAGRLHALDRETGNEKWGPVDMGRLIGSPAIADGTVFVGDYNHTAAAFDAETGDLEWSYSDDSADGEPDFAASPAVADGYIYFVDKDDGQLDSYLYVLDTETGDLESRTFLFDAPTIASPAVVDGALYVGGETNELYVVQSS